MTRAPCSRRCLIVGQRRADARVVGDPAVLQRDVEVDAHEDALARGVQVLDGALVHLSRSFREPQRAPGHIRSATNLTRSATRQL